MNTHLLRDPGDDGTSREACVGSDAASRTIAALRAELRDVEEWLQLAHEAIGAGTWVHDFDDNTLRCDEGLRRIYGLAPSASVTFETFLAHVLEEDRVKVLSGLEAMHRSTAERWDVEFRALHTNGTLLWIRALGKASRGSDGRLRQLAGINVDITARKQAEQSWQEVDHKLRLSLEAAALGAWSWDLETGRMDADHVMWSMHGFGPGEPVTHIKDSSRFIHPDDVEEGRRRYKRCRNEGVPFRYEYRVVFPNGETRWVSSLSKRREGTSTLVGIVQDITERKRAEEALRASEARLRMMIDNAEHGLWDWDITTGQEQLDDRWYAILGYAPREVPPTYNFWEDGIHPKDRDRVLAVLKRHLDSETPLFDTDYRARTRDGGWVWINTRGRVYQRDADGRPLRMMGTIHDITPRKLEEARRERLETELRHAQKLDSLGVLASGIAHDFNNLLTSMLCNASLALSQLPVDSPARTRLEHIDKAARLAANLTEQMMAYGGCSVPTQETFRFDTLVEDMVALAKPTLSKKIDLQVDVRPALVEGEAAQLQQVIVNILTNAAEAVGDAPGVVRVRSVVRDAGVDELRSPFVPDAVEAGRFVCLEVEDSGTGIDHDTLTRIFDPFFTTKFAGRGLGLAAVLGIVRGHRGSIVVDSTPGRGTTFRVFLPVASTDPVETTSSVAAERGATERTILVIDDEPVVRVAIQGLLERAGWHVLLARDGGEGLLMVDRHRHEIDAVLVDLTMPVMDGAEVLAHLREREPHLPVILMSGYRPQSSSIRAVQDGRIEFIKKPIDPLLLVPRVEEAISSHGLKQAGAGASRALPNPATLG